MIYAGEERGGGWRFRGGADAADDFGGDEADADGQGLRAFGADFAGVERGDAGGGGFLHDGGEAGEGAELAGGGAGGGKAGDDGAHEAGEAGGADGVFGVTEGEGDEGVGVAFGAEQVFGRDAAGGEAQAAMQRRGRGFPAFASGFPGGRGAGGTMKKL